MGFGNMSRIETLIKEAMINQRKHGEVYINVTRVIAALAQVYEKHLPDAESIASDPQAQVSIICDEVAAELGVDFKAIYDEVTGIYFD